MPATARRTSRSAARLLAAALSALLSAGVGAAVLGVVLIPTIPEAPCRPSGASGSIRLDPGGGGQRVGASEYGGPGDPSSASTGASGADLDRYPASYAELGGVTFQTATAMGGLPYMTPLRVGWGDRSAIAYKRDFGLGGGPVAGRPRVIDLWWRFAVALGIPYENGRWSGAVRVTRPPDAGAGNLLAQSVGQPAAGLAVPDPGCRPALTPAGVALTRGPRALVGPSGLASAPRGAPEAVTAMIAAGNQIVGKPYVYGSGHGLALDQVAPAYDCSSSVEHVLYGGRLLPVTYGAASGTLESFGVAGPGRWVTLYASASHVFMYVAGIRWDTWNAAGPQDGGARIGWHPLIRSSAGYVVRHPAGL